MQQIKLLNTTLKLNPAKKNSNYYTNSHTYTNSQFGSMSMEKSLKNTNETKILTNLSNRGLILKYHGMKTTLFFTIPRSKLKSPIQDLSTKILNFDHCRTSLVFLQLNALGLRDNRNCLILACLRIIRVKYHYFLARILTQKRSLIIQQIVDSQQCLFRQLQMPIV